MKNEELKKKIVEIIINAIWKDAEADYDSTDETEAGSIADALIAAGIGDIKTEREIGASATAMAVFEAAKAEQLKNQYCRALLNLARRYVVKTNMTLPHGNEPHSRSTDIEMLALYIIANECEQAEKELAEEAK